VLAYRSESLPARDMGRLNGRSLAVRPAPRPLPEAQTEARRPLWTRRRQVRATRTAAQNRLVSAPRRLQADIAAHPAWLDPRLSVLEDDLDPTLRSSPVWGECDALDRRVRGSGPGGARTLVLEWPEWGPLSRHCLATLAGVAPFHRDSGALRGRRPRWGGRAAGRAALYRSAPVAVRHNPILTACDERLGAARKAKQVALTASGRQR
jgi:transposase